MRTILLILLCALALGSAEPNPVLRAWRVNPQAANVTNEDLAAVLPDVHSVRADDRYAYAESAGLALQSLGPLEANGIDVPAGRRNFLYRIPLQPRPAAAKSMATPIGVIGAFTNGVPIYNFTSVVSWRDQNLWHLDAAAAAGGMTPLLSSLLGSDQHHSPLIGFAFDGHPIYGPYGVDADGRVRRFRSSYRLRKIVKRDVLPDGTVLGPSQEGPAVDSSYPAGTFVEDYEYVAGSGELDEHNGRLARTPEYPEGTYAYFLSTDTGNRVMFPYLIGPTYSGQVSAAELVNAAHAERPDEISVPSVTYQPLDAADRGRISLSAPVGIDAGKPQILSLEFHDARGRRLRFLERTHERPVHLVVASKDLQEFAHIHPELQPDDTFAVTCQFGNAGEYWLFADYTLPGAAPSIARFRVNVRGAARKAEPVVADALPPDRTIAKVRHGIRIVLTLPPSLHAGDDLAFRFSVSDPATGQPVSDLQPYLGAWAHILIARSDGARFIHAHPLEDAWAGAQSDPWQHTHTAPGPSPASIGTVTGFREPGLYRLWVQFQRNGEIVTVPFTFTVGARIAALSPVAEQKADVRVIVSAAGFTPARISLPAGKPMRIGFERRDAENCASAVLFPEFNLRKELPAGKTTLIELPAAAPREISFSCGMKMFRGTLLVR